MPSTQEQPGRSEAGQPWPLDTLVAARNLVMRFEEGETFRHYVVRRLLLVIPLLLLIVGISVASAIGVFGFLASKAAWLALPGIILAPFIWIGSLFVQSYVFFSWLENRSLAIAHPHLAKPAGTSPFARAMHRVGLDVGELPPVPWLLALIFFVVPLLMLALVAGKIAIALIALAVAGPAAFAYLDR